MVSFQAQNLSPCCVNARYHHKATTVVFTILFTVKWPTNLAILLTKDIFPKKNASYIVNSSDTSTTPIPVCSPSSLPPSWPNGISLVPLLAGLDNFPVIYAGYTSWRIIVQCASSEDIWANVIYSGCRVMEFWPGWRQRGRWTQWYWFCGGI